MAIRKICTRGICRGDFIMQLLLIIIKNFCLKNLISLFGL